MHQSTHQPRPPVQVVAPCTRAHLKDIARYPALLAPGHMHNLPALQAAHVCPSCMAQLQQALRQHCQAEAP